MDLLFFDKNGKHDRNPISNMITKAEMININTFYLFKLY